ncbi:MAG: hypothetical protein ABW047_08375 [Nitrospiraceae bacterium]
MAQINDWVPEANPRGLLVGRASGSAMQSLAYLAWIVGLIVVFIALVGLL